MRAGEKARLGTTRRVGRWALAAVVALATLAVPAKAGATAGFVSDGFTEPPLGGHWQVVRPRGVGSAEVVDGRLELSVPAGVNHDPWRRNDSVRAVQAVADADLSVEARFESMPVTRYQMQGLTVVQGDEDFLRYEVHHDGSGPRLFASTTTGGSPLTRVDRPLSGLTEVYLRVERSGDQWTLLWSPDGAAWSTGGSFTHAMAVTQVGPFVGNYGTGSGAPAFTAAVDYVVDTTVGDGEPPADPTPPQVGSVSVATDATTARLSFATDEPASAFVEYGLTDAYAATSATSTLGTAHEVVLDGLAPDTTYHYRVVATDAAGNTAVTPDATFTTEPDPEPEPEPDPEPDPEPEPAPEPEPEPDPEPEPSPTAGFVPDEFTEPPLGAHWQVVRAHGVGSAEVVGGRLELSVPAGVNHDPWQQHDTVRAVQTVADGDLSLQARFESVPTTGHQMQGLTVVQGDADFLRFDVHHNGSGLRLFASTTVAGAPQTRINQALPALTQVFLRLERDGDQWTLSWSPDGTSWSTGGTFTHAMTAAQAGVFVGNYRRDGNPPAFTARVDYVAGSGAAPPPGDDTTPPGISEVSVTATATTAVVTWRTDEPATGHVEYGTTPAYGSTSPASPSGTTHSVTLAGLAPETTYHYRVVVTDAADNPAATVDATFTTGPDTAPEPGDGLVSDDFGAPLGPHWQVVRPHDVGAAEVVDGRLRLSVPPGVNHDPWATNDSVRVVQAVADADLSVEARFESIPTARYQMQGLTVVDGDRDFLRFDVHHDGSGLRLFVSTTTDGSPRTWVNQPLPALGQVYLRLERVGDQWTMSWSPDGVTWSAGGSFTHAMTARQVGPFVATYDNQGNPPAFTAVVDYVAAVGQGPPPGDPTDDTTPPVISGVSVTAAGTTARVGWHTDEPTTGVVEYGPTAAYGSVSATTPLGGSHEVTLTGLVADTTYHYRVVATDPAGNTATEAGTFHTTAGDGGPTIDLWYGTDLSYGAPTRTQEWVNILGNVSDPDGVASLTYSVNGGPSRPLSIGPDQRRLQWPGDFNADIPVADLTVGDNTVTLTATDTGGRVTERTVTVEWRSGAGAALPYTLEWDPGRPLAEQAQPVDGKWTVTAAGLRTAITGYDRIVAVGDVNWTDYELTVPITVHEFGPAAYTFLSGPPMIGVGLRWNGHTAVDSQQPAWGWYPTGAFAWYRFYENGGRFVLSGNDNSPARYTTPAFTIGTTYLLKVRVETLGGGVTRYQVKLWPAGTSEPTSWLSTIDEDDGPAAGSVVLIAHQLDGTFGDVEIRPL